ncbi:ankyrin repeat-containing domain protein [Nemania sp. FL0031]|nr:ankyrin repeat-containing domain protein [Nemania sp. FL0031]
MEALGVGANVAAFVVIASQLSQFLFTTFSSIQDAPDNVRRVAGHLLQLHGVLEQLKLSPFACHDTALAGHVGLCISDLNTLADTLRKVQSTPNQSGASMLWRRFKSFLNEEKLQKICEQIIIHSSTLGLRLSILRSNATKELLSDTRTVAQLMNDLSTNVEKQTISLNSQFGGLDNTLHSHHDKLQTELSSIRAAVQNMSTMSQKNADSMVGLLNGLKKSIISPTQDTRPQEGADDTSKRKCKVDNEWEEAEPSDISGSDHRLVRSIARLCSLVQEKNRTFDTNAEDDTQAEDIIEDLQILVGSTQKYLDTTPPTQLSTANHTTIDKKAARSDLRRFGQAFGQFKLVVNEEGRRRNCPFPIAIRQKRGYFEFPLGNLGTLSLLVTKRARVSHLEGTLEESDCEVRTMVLSFLPRDLRQFMIIASTNQGDFLPSSMLPISRLAVNRVLPFGSRVFGVAMVGTLQELQAMLRDGAATLKDHDEYGLNLLFYAAQNRRIEMLAYLLENGLDVDCLEPLVGDGRRSLLESCVKRTDYRMDEGYWQIDVCKLLLEAGADPTPTGSGHSCLVDEVSVHRHPDMARLFWMSSHFKLFVNINDPMAPGYEPPIMRTIWRMMHLDDAGPLSERLRMLLDAGASVHTRTSRGESCLDFFLLQAGIYFAYPGQVQDRFLALKLLVERGADVYEVDGLNGSMAENAYTRESCYGMTGSFVGDLWDAVLQNCGYNLSEFRKICQRRAEYNKNYTRRHFEMLWEGMEDQCPYWDDKPWPPSIPTQRHVLPECTSAETMGVDALQELAEPISSQEYGAGGATQEVEQNLQGGTAPKAPGAFEQVVLKAQSEIILSTGGDDTDNERYLAHNQSCQFMGYKDMPALFENPWV